jgi:hypothetical protein
MNLELILPLFIVFCAALGAVIAYAIGGSALSGALIGGAIGFSPLFVLAVVYALLQRWSPERPDCICGRCKPEDYDFLESMSDIEEHVYFYRCPHCGRKYREHGDRFGLETPEGIRPYMTTSRWGRWIKDGPQGQ